MVPVLVNDYATGYFEELIGDRTFLMLSSDVIVNILVWVLVIGFMLVLGAGGILKRFGIVGILGLIVAGELAAKSYPTKFFVAEGSAEELMDKCAPFLSPEDRAAEIKRLAAMDIVLVIAKTVEIKRRKRTEGKRD